MDELKQSLENLDELRREAKDYANNLVLPNNERLENDNVKNTDRQTELLQQREEQEAKLKMNLEKSFIGKITKKVQEKLTGNLERRQALLKQDYLEQVAEAAEKADFSLSQIGPLQDIERMKYDDAATFSQTQVQKLEHNILMENFPTYAIPKITDDELFHLEKQEESQHKILEKKNGSVFTSILIILTTLTVGVIAAVMVMK